MNYKQKAKLTAKVIRVINDHEKVTDYVITETCKKYGANENFVKIVGAWDKIKTHKNQVSLF